jgi:heptosyltransferase-3
LSQSERTLVSLPALAAAQARFAGTRTIFAASPIAAPLLTANQIADVVLSADDVRLLHLLSGNIEALTTALGPVLSAVLWGGETLKVATAALRERGVEVIHSPSRPPEGSELHIADYLVRTIDEEAPGARLLECLHAPSADESWLDEHFGDMVSRPTFTLHPGSGSTRKNWSPDSFASVANMARKHMGVQCAFVSGPADAGILEQILPALDEPPAVIARDWTLGQVAALLYRSSMYLGNDSGISHLAGALGVPGIALFGPTRPEVWAPRGGSVRAVGRPSLREHQPEDVFEALRAVALSSA